MLYQQAAFSLSSIENMKVNVLFFGATADSVGEREVEVSLEEDVDAENAFAQIFDKFPNLQRNHNKKSLHFAVNQEYANGDEIIENGDELAIFTAVSGG